MINSNCTNLILKIDSNQHDKIDEVKEVETTNSCFEEEQGSHTCNDSKSDTHFEAKANLKKSILKQHKSVSYDL